MNVKTDEYKKSDWILYISGIRLWSKFDVNYNISDHWVLTSNIININHYFVNISVYDLT